MLNQSKEHTKDLNEKSEDTKEVNEKDKKPEKDKQWYTKHYIETKRFE